MYNFTFHNFTTITITDKSSFLVTLFYSLAYHSLTGHRLAGPSFQQLRELQQGSEETVCAGECWLLLAALFGDQAGSRRGGLGWGRVVRGLQPLHVIVLPREQKCRITRPLGLGIDTNDDILM